MGSRSDLETMRHASDVLEELGVDHEVRIVSAHRTPDAMFEYAQSAADRGLEVIIAGAGGAAHLPGMVAAKDDAARHRRARRERRPERPRLPAVDRADAPRRACRNRGDRPLPAPSMPALLAAQIIATSRPDLRARLEARRRATAEEVLADSEVKTAD